jgi:hypothetical protein
MDESAQFLRPAAAAALAALLLTGCSGRSTDFAKPAQAVSNVVKGCRDFTIGNTLFDHLDSGMVPVYLREFRDDMPLLQRAAKLDNDWSTLAYSANVVVEALGKVEADLEAGRTPVWTEDQWIGTAAQTVLTECRRAQGGPLGGLPFGTS